MKYPVQIAYPFQRGTFLHPVVNGVPTQSIVKTRWPDGSAKHVIFSFLLEGNQGDIKSLGFVEGNSIPLEPFPLNAEIELSGRRVSLTDLPSWEWLPNSFVYADHTGAHDLPSPSGTKARLIFHVTYYPEINNAEVRFIVENANTQAAGECLAPIRFFTNGVEVFSNLNLTWQQQMMPCASRFTKTFWASPRGKINFKFDLKHLISTGALPNFDTSIKVNESVIADLYSLWLSSDKDISHRSTNQWGLFAKSMATAGARTDLGPFPTWTTLWLYTSDPRMEGVDFQSAEIASRFAMHWRENDPTKLSFGRPIRIWDRPTIQLKNANTFPRVADMDTWGLTPDPAHKPNPFFARYLLGGEYYHLEEMFFWEGFCAGWSNGAGINAAYGRGPTGKEGGIPGSSGANFQIRGQGWVFGGRAQVAWICPDDLSEKDYFTQLTKDALTHWEGQRSINRPDTSDPRFALWDWGRRIDPQESPVRLWEKGNGGLVGEPVDGQKATLAISPWEVSFLVYNLLTGKRLDFDVQPLLDWLKPSIKSLGKLLAAYRVGTSNSSGYFQTIEEVRNAMVPTFDENTWWLSQRNLDHGYTLLAMQQVIASENPELWNWIKAEVYDKINWANNPKWAITPSK